MCCDRSCLFSSCIDSWALPSFQTLMVLLQYVSLYVTAAESYIYPRGLWQEMSTSCWRSIMHFFQTKGIKSKRECYHILKFVSSSYKKGYLLNQSSQWSWIYKGRKLSNNCLIGFHRGKKEMKEKNTNLQISIWGLSQFQLQCHKLTGRYISKFTLA